MMIGELPECCIATVISLTTPADACRLSCVNSLFKSAADSDAVWDHFLPPDYRSLISSTSDGPFRSLLSDDNDSHSCSSSLPPSPCPFFPTKKQLYFSLCHNPILIDEGKMSFHLDKESGKKCYMISPRNLTIVWGDTPAYWRWTSSDEHGSRFPEVAELIRVCWLEIRGKITASILSPRTTYGAYFVFKSVAVAYGFADQPVEVTFGYVGNDIHKRAVYLDTEREGRIHQPQFRCSRSVRLSHRRRFVQWAASVPRQNDGHYPEERRDGWSEVELGEVFIGEEGEKNELEMSVMEVAAGNWKEGLIVQGIEIRPKHINNK